MDAAIKCLEDYINRVGDDSDDNDDDTGDAKNQFVDKLNKEREAARKNNEKQFKKDQQRVDKIQKNNTQYEIEDNEFKPLHADESLAAIASPWLDSYVDFSRKWAPEAHDGFHEACGLWVLSRF